MRSEGEFHGLGKGVSHASITSVADQPWAVRSGCLDCALITRAPPDPHCTAGLPPSVLIFPTRLRDIPSDSMSQPFDLQLRAGTQALFILKAGGCRSLPFQLRKQLFPQGLPTPAAASNQLVLQVHAGFGSNFEDAFQAVPQSSHRAVLWDGAVSGMRWPPLEVTKPRAAQRCVLLPIPIKAVLQILTWMASP